MWSPDGRRLAFIREEKGTGRAVIWDAERDQMTPVGDPFTARIELAPQWDPSGKTLFVAAALPEAPAAPYRVRSVKNTDARIPGDQFFTDTGTATTRVDRRHDGGATTVLTPQPIVLRSFQLSPTGRHILYVAPSPETLGIIGKEQNDTFVLTVPGRRRRPAPARKLTERGRFCVGGRRRASRVRSWRAADGACRSTAASRSRWLETLKLSVGEPAWSPDR